MAWSSNRTWVAAEDLTAALLNTFLRDQLDETAPAVATAAGRLIVTDGANSITERSPTADYVATSETTASTSYTDLATAGPAVTVTTGTQALVIISCNMANNTAAAASQAAVGITGATTNTASNDEALRYESSVVNDEMAASYLWIPTLTAGSNTFTLKYSVAAGTGTFRWRRLAVIPF